MNKVVFLLFFVFASFLASDALLVLDCPLPQMGQNKTKASAFLYVNGSPTINESMALKYELNDSHAFLTYPVLTDAVSGRHEFVLDTRFGGTYSLVAVSGNSTSNECSLGVFEKQTEKIPELNELLIVLVFLVAVFVAQRTRA